MYRRFFKSKNDIATRLIYPITLIDLNQLKLPKKYLTNYIKTTKYTIWTFIPLNLWEQLHRFANIYFIFILILNFIPDIDAFAKEIAPIPVLITLAIVAIKDAYEDFRRYLLDRKVNKKPCEVYSIQENQYVIDQWQHLRPGDFVRLHTNDIIPADILLLATSNSTGICHIETSNLDGESNLKQREIIPNLSNKDEFSPLTFLYPIEVEAPSAELYKFHGKILLPDIRIPIHKNNMLLRGCVLRNTDYVIGIVIYAGCETKAALNNSGVRFKRSKLEKQINMDVIWCVLILVLVCVTGAIGSAVWHQNLPGDDVLFVALDRNSSTSTPAYQGFLNFWRFVIIFQTIIPLPLYVTIEFVKMHQVWHMNNDLQLYDNHLDRRIEIHAFNIPEDLGQIEYVFTDKTGTLTENKMEFKRASINGIDYNADDDDIEIQSIRTDEINQPDDNTNPSFNINDLNANSARSYNELIKSIYNKESLLFYSSRCLPPVIEALDLDVSLKNSQHILNIPQINDERKNKKILLQYEHNQFNSPYSISTEELNLHRQQSGSANHHFDSNRDIKLDDQHDNDENPTMLKDLQLNLSKEKSVQNDKNQFEEELEVNTARTLTVRIHNGSSLELPIESDICAQSSTDLKQCPLSDNTLFNSYESESPDEICLVKEACKRNYKLLQRGVDFILLWLPKDELQKWLNEVYEIETGNENSTEAMMIVMDKLESNFILLGATGIEDRLQNGVPETIDALREAGMHVWMLTGDKQETAVNIARSANLITSQHKVMYINSHSEDLISTEMNFTYITLVNTQYNTTNNNSSNNNPIPLALVIDGESLNYILNNERNKFKFIKLIEMCTNIICCRSTPGQKAAVVCLVKDELNAQTLAIGDGANDVNMIQVANVGIGINSGEEGMQAVMASDFAISRFYLLKRLLLVHGHCCYDKLAHASLYLFYKDAVYIFLLFWFQMFNGFSGSNAIDQLSQMLFSVTMTGLPPFIMGIWDNPLDDKTLLANPILYRSGIYGNAYRPWLFWMNIFDALWQSLIVFFLSYFTYSDDNIGLWEFAIGHRSRGSKCQKQTPQQYSTYPSARYSSGHRPPLYQDGRFPFELDPKEYPSTYQLVTSTNLQLYIP
ncbi:phospholipid-transporting atpase [Schistosoma mansoni]|uniref:phospholipid-transporting atpase n=1 Tax=Schistosoma mansoni TaxID=6183 RepID=UPI00022C818E|nr:phospholipid-transporting atpase [Schistosoma mansoni]|eukprot:XP_018645576.1 phospholipid-transporting atpase [Schistosoma mansoni]